MIKVSVAVPIYGVEKYIERCAESLFGQTYENLEFIFVNDHTQDLSMSILENVIKKYPQRQKQIIIVNHETNQGLAVARNTAIKHVTGQFVLWVDSDDFVDINLVTYLVEEQMKSDADIVLSDVYKFDGKKNVLVCQKSNFSPREYLHAVLREDVEHWIWGKLIRIDLYLKNNISVKPGANMGEDFQVLPQLVYHANKITYVNKPLYYYNVSNLKSYGHLVREDVQMQRWATYEVLVNNIITDEYGSDLVYLKLHMCYFQIKTYLLANNLSKEYLSYLCDRLNEIPFEVYRQYPLFKRCLLAFFYRKNGVPSFGKLTSVLLVLYVHLIDFVKSIR